MCLYPEKVTPPHAAFLDNSIPDGVEPRTSIEVRLVVVTKKH